MAKITENNLGNYSTFTTDKGYKLDEFVEFTDIQADEYPLIDELQNLLRKQNKTPEELTRMSELNTKFADKIPTAWDWNKFCSCLISMEKFILVEINGYIALMKKDVKEYTDARKSEIEALIGQMDYKELWNKDVLYKRFNQVKYNGNVYTARKDNIGQVPNPIQDTEYWYITSMKGETGATGARGYDGSNLVFKDEYSDNVVYNKENVVGYDGRLYVCKVDNTKGILPTNKSNWTLGVDRGQSMILVTAKSTVTLKEDSNIVPINISSYNIQEDTLNVFFQGSYLEEKEEYNKSLNGMTIESVDGSQWKKGSTFNYLLFKNVTASVPSADPSLMPNESITKNKLNPTVFDDVNNKIVILNGEGELKEKVNKSDFDVYKGEYNTYKSEVKSSLDDKASNKNLTDGLNTKVNNTDYSKLNLYVGTTTGTSTAYIGTVSNSQKNYVDGQVITLVPHIDCGDNPTFNLNGIGAVNLVNPDGNLKAGDMKANKPYSFVRVGNSFFIRSGGKPSNFPEWFKFKDSWIIAKTTSYRRWFSTSCYSVGNIFTFGGKEIYTSDTTMSESFNTTTGSLTTVKNMPTGRFGLSSAVVNEKIYVIGGNRGNGDRVEVECYDTNADTWTTKAPMLTGRKFLSCVAVGNDIYAIGGTYYYIHDDIGSNVVECYNTLTNTWTIKANMPTGRFGLSCVAIGNDIYAIGGTNDGKTPLSVVECYNTLTNTWTIKAPFTYYPRFYLTCSAIGNDIYAIGGTDDGKHPVNTVTKYNTINNSWSNAKSTNLNRLGLSSISTGKSIYVIGGAYPKTYSSDELVGLDTSEFYVP